jgi:group I intron endonuclease
MFIGFIYKIEFPNGKYYIGQTTDSLEQRKKGHKQSAKNGITYCVYNALRKYNMIDTFDLIEIDTADTLEELNEKEKRYIIEYNSYYMNGRGYNMTHGGDGTNGYVYTDEVKQKMSENAKKAKRTPEGKQKSSAAQTKRYKNIEERKKHCERMKKRVEDNPKMGKQISESQKKRMENPEVRKQLSEARKKHFENPEARIINSVSQKKRFENPEERKKNSHAKENKPFDVFKTDGTIIGTFTYQFEAMDYLQKEYNIASRIKISEVLSGKRKYSHGFLFKYK